MFPLNVLAQKCNTAFYSFVFTKNTALKPNPPFSSLSLPSTARREDPGHDGESAAYFTVTVEAP